jgi:hypothetical protein
LVNCETDNVLAALMIERASGHSLEREPVDRIVRPLPALVAPSIRAA